VSSGRVSLFDAGLLGPTSDAGTALATDGGFSPVSNVFLQSPIEGQVVLNPVRILGLASYGDTLQIEIDGENRGSASPLNNGSFSFDAPPLTVGAHRAQVRNQRSASSEVIAFQVRDDPKSLQVGCSCNGGSGALFVFSVLLWFRRRQRSIPRPGATAARLDLTIDEVARSAHKQRSY
jgi:hypothetical protein